MLENLRQQIVRLLALNRKLLTERKLLMAQIDDLDAAIVAQTTATAALTAAAAAIPPTVDLTAAITAVTANTAAVTAATAALPKPAAS